MRREYTAGDSTSSRASSVERELRDILRRHAPEKVPNIPKELQRWAGEEGRLLQIIREKYGVGKAVSEEAKGGRSGRSESEGVDEGEEVSGEPHD
jgi:hypothetical protein